MKRESLIGKSDLILLLCDNLNKIYGKTYIQKILFIIENELKLKQFSYDAYFYGPYSKELDEEISELIKNGLIKETTQTLKNGSECYVYTLTEEGKRQSKTRIASISPELKKQIDNVCFRFSSFTPTQLLKYVYREYPKSAENSIFFD